MTQRIYLIGNTPVRLDQIVWVTVVAHDPAAKAVFNMPEKPDQWGFECVFVQGHSRGLLWEREEYAVAARQALIDALVAFDAREYAIASLSPRERNVIDVSSWTEIDVARRLEAMKP